MAAEYSSPRSKKLLLPAGSSRRKASADVSPIATRIRGTARGLTITALCTGDNSFTITIQLMYINFYTDLAFESYYHFDDQEGEVCHYFKIKLIIIIRHK